MNESELINEWKSKYDLKTGRLKEKLSDECYNFIHNKTELTDKIIKEETIAKFRESYDIILEVLKEYCDLPENYYSIIAIWILGTYVHKQFDTFPELFINAPKGSGKSRLLRLISNLAWNGKVVLDLKEAGLFRTARLHTICIDEFEKVGHKDSGTLRTLINAAYKKGATVERMRKIKNNGQEEQVVETFQLYCPLVMANIWGVEDVLADRCITLILEKSDFKQVTKLMELFDLDIKIQGLKQVLCILVYTLQSVVTSANIYKWNTYIKSKYNVHYNTYTHNTTQDYITTLTNDELELFNKIDATEMEGRNLELFFPIFLLAKILGDDIFNSVLKISKGMVDEKRTEEFAENKDISLIDFISKQDAWRGSYKSVHEITQGFRLTTMEDPEEDKWLNPKWVGRALKRNKLILAKRRLSKGIEVAVDIDKAKLLISKFKKIEKTEVSNEKVM